MNPRRRCGLRLTAIFIDQEHFVFEVLKPHRVLFIEEVNIPKTVLLFSCFQVHLHQYFFVKKGIKLTEQLVPFNS